MEVLLRVKQTHDPLFAFLLPGGALHPFYRWVALFAALGRRWL